MGMAYARRRLLGIGASVAVAPTFVMLAIACNGRIDDLAQPASGVTTSRSPEAGTGPKDDPLPGHLCSGRPFTDVQPVPGLSTYADESSVVFTHDELTAYVATTPREGGAGGIDIMVSRRASVQVPFPPPELLAGVNGPGDESSLALSGDNRDLFFSSTTSTGGGADLFGVQRLDDGEVIGRPEALGPEVNTTESELFPWMAGSSEVFFARGGGDVFEIWRSGRKIGSFALAQRFEQLASASHVAGIVLENDSRTIYFGSTRAAGDNGGRFDVWSASRRTIADPFSTPEPVASLLVNTEFDERPTWISSDACRLYILSNRPSHVDGGGGRDLWVATRTPP